MAVHGNDVYIGGRFDKVASAGSDQFVGINSATGANLNLNIGDFNDTVRDFKVTSTAIYVVGDFTSWSGVDRKYVAKFDLDGNLDNSFNPGVNITGIGYGPYMLAVEVSGNSVYLGGYFTLTSGGVTRLGICKLNSDTGAIDSAFRGLNSGNSGINKIMLDPEGGLWITPDETYYSSTSAGPGYCNYGRLVKLNANTGNPDFSQKWALQQVIVGINGRDGIPPPIGMTSSTMLISDVSESLGLRAAGGTILGSDFLPPGGVDVGRVAKGHSQSSGTLDACFDGTNYWLAIQSAQDFREADGSFSDPKLYDNQSVTSLVKVNSSGDLLTDFSYPSMQSLMASIGVAQTGDTLRHYELTTNVAYYGSSVYALTAGYTTSSSNLSMSVLTKINPSTNSVVIKRRVDGPAGSTAFFIQNGRYLYFYGRPNHQHKSATGTSAQQDASVVQGGCLVEYDMETDAWRTILATLPGYTATTSIIYGLCYLDGYLYATGPLGVYKVNVTTGAIDSTFNTNVLTSPLIAMRAIETDGTSIYLGLSGTYKTKTGVAKISAAGVLDSAFTSTLTSGQATSLFYSGTLGNLAVSRSSNIGIDFLNLSTGAKAYNKRVQGPAGRIKTVNGKVLLAGMSPDSGVYYPTDYATEFGSSLVNAYTVWQIAKNWDGYSYYPGQLQQGISWIRGNGTTSSISVNASQEKAYLAGRFGTLTAYPSGTVSTRPRLAKINLADMTVDNTFVPASCSVDLSFVHCVGSNVYVSPNGASSPTYNGTAIYPIFLVDGTSGTLDQAFSAKIEKGFMGFNNLPSVSKVYYSGSGSIFCMGTFAGYGYQDRIALAKVNLRTGLLDSKWLPQAITSGEHPNSSIGRARNIVVSEDGKSVYAGMLNGSYSSLRRYNAYDGRTETVAHVPSQTGMRVLGTKLYATHSASMPCRSSAFSVINSLTFGVSLYVGVGDNGQILTSPDGTTWTARTSGTTAHLYGVAYDGAGRFVAVGAGGVALTSVNGTTWQACSGAGSADLNAVTYGSSKFVAVGRDGQVAKSSDGQNFSATSVTSEDLYGVTFGASKFVAVGTSGKIMTSADATTWAARTSGVSARLLGASYGTTTSSGTLFAAVGEGGALLTSADGVTWTQQSSGLSDTVYGCSFANGALYLLGSLDRYSRNLSGSWTNVTGRSSRSIVYTAVSNKVISAGVETPLTNIKGQYAVLVNQVWTSGTATTPGTVTATSSVTATTAQGVACLDISTGLLNTAFSTATGATGAVYDAFPSGAFVYLVGDFTAWKGASHTRIVKVNASDAQVAAGWSAGTGLNNTGQCVIISQSGAVYVSGNFSTYNGVSIPTNTFIVKLDANGTRDTLFTAPTVASNSVPYEIIEAKISNKF